MMPYTKEAYEMDINISRYNQEEAVNQDLDLVHLLILEWYIVSKEENTIESKIIDEEIYHYINYEQVAKDLPIIRLCSETIRRRYKKMVDKGILKCKLVRDDKYYPYYVEGENFYLIVKQTTTVKKVNYLN